MTNAKLELAELHEAILEGVFETPLWSTFLRLLKRAAGAEHATLIFRPPGRSYRESLHLYASNVSDEDVAKVYSTYLASLDHLSDLGMTEGLAYTHEQLYPPREPKHLPFYREVVLPSKINATRAICVTEKTGVTAWLTISRSGDDFTVRDGLLLEAIAPTLRAALRFYLELERERYSTGVSTDAMRHLHFGWIGLDADAYVVGGNSEGLRVLDESAAMKKSPPAAWSRYRALWSARFIAR